MSVLVGALVGDSVVELLLSIESVVLVADVVVSVTVILEVEVMFSVGFT